MVFMSENEFSSTITIIADQQCFVKRFCISQYRSTEGVPSTRKYSIYTFVLGRLHLEFKRRGELKI